MQILPKPLKSQKCSQNSSKASHPNVKNFTELEQFLKKHFFKSKLPYNLDSYSSFVKSLRETYKHIIPNHLFDELRKDGNLAGYYLYNLAVHCDIKYISCINSKNQHSKSTQPLSPQQTFTEKVSIFDALRIPKVKSRRRHFS